MMSIITKNKEKRLRKAYEEVLSFLGIIPCSNISEQYCSSDFISTNFFGYAIIKNPPIIKQIVDIHLPFS